MIHLSIVNIVLVFLVSFVWSKIIKEDGWEAYSRLCVIMLSSVLAEALW